MAVALVCFFYSHNEGAFFSQKNEDLFHILNAPYTFNPKISLSVKKNYLSQYVQFRKRIPKEDTRNLFELTYIFHIFHLNNKNSSTRNYPKFLRDLSKSELSL
jgi:hypothetical protein